MAFFVWSLIKFVVRISVIKEVHSKNNTLKLSKDKKKDTLISAPTATRNKLFDKSWTIMVKRLSIPASEYKTTPKTVIIIKINFYQD